MVVFALHLAVGCLWGGRSFKRKRWLFPVNDFPLDLRAGCLSDRANPFRQQIDITCIGRRSKAIRRQLSYLRHELSV